MRRVRMTCNAYSNKNMTTKVHGSDFYGVKLSKRSSIGDGAIIGNDECITTTVDGHDVDIGSKWSHTNYIIDCLLSII